MVVQLQSSPSEKRDLNSLSGLHTHSHGATWVHHLDLDGAITSMRLYTSVMEPDFTFKIIKTLQSLIATSFLFYTKSNSTQGVAPSQGILSY
jgi:hypothetical protein